MHGASVGDCNAGVRCHIWRILKPVFQIIPVRTAADLEATITLFRTYAASLDVDLAYQDFEGEMAAMPGKYTPRAGELLLARDADTRAVGCVGLRPLDASGCCEMKRLYVAPEGRGSGLGKALAQPAGFPLPPASQN
jgi:GNAT superfamily N-acetyltransferase